MAFFKRIIKTLTAGVLILSFFAIAISCGSTPSATNTTDNTSLVVTYYGKEVYRRGTGWASVDDVSAALKSKKKKIIIFGAPWCKSCLKLKRLIKEANINKKIIYVNIEEQWAKDIFLKLDLSGIPTMLEVSKNNNQAVLKSGTSDIIMYLLIRD